jgi:hypothetical protein
MDDRKSVDGKSFAGPGRIRIEVVQSDKNAESSGAMAARNSRPTMNSPHNPHFPESQGEMATSLPVTWQAGCDILSTLPDAIRDPCPTEWLLS